MYQFYRDRPTMVMFMIVANIVLSAWALYLDPVINNDGITYLGVADMILQGQWQDANQYYSWPFYSILVAGVTFITGLQLEHSAILLNTVFAISLTLAFTSIVAELSGNDKRIIIIAMLVILLFPSINKYRPFIIRDFAYLSFYLWSLYFIFRYCTTHDKRHLVAWILCASTSCFFRIEGIAFVLVAPYFLFLFTNNHIAHRKKLITFFSLGLITTSAGLLLWYLDQKYHASIVVAQNQGLDINNIFDLFLANTKAHLGDENVTLSNYIKVAVGNTGDVFYELIRRMAIFYFLFALYGYWKGWGIKDHFSRRIWLVYVLTNIVVLWVFSLYNNFLVSRYTMASALTLLIIAPFVIDRIIGAFRQISWWKRSASFIAIFLLLGASIEGLDLRTKKHYIKEAGEWMAENLEPEARIYSNERLLIYYAERGTEASFNDEYSNVRMWRYFNDRFITSFNYIALSVNREIGFEDAYRRTAWHQFGRPLIIIEGPKDRYVFVHKIRDINDTLKPSS